MIDFIKDIIGFKIDFRNKPLIIKLPRCVLCLCSGLSLCRYKNMAKNNPVGSQMYTLHDKIINVNDTRLNGVSIEIIDDVKNQCLLYINKNQKDKKQAIKYGVICQFSVSNSFVTSNKEISLKYFDGYLYTDSKEDTKILNRNIKLNDLI